MRNGEMTGKERGERREVGEGDRLGRMERRTRRGRSRVDGGENGEGTGKVERGKRNSGGNEKGMGKEKREMMEDGGGKKSRSGRIMRREGGS